MMKKVNNQLGKAELRRTLLKKRQSMSEKELREKSSCIASQLESLPLFTQSNTILAYFSFRQEPDLSSLFVDTKQWGLPRVDGESLIWHRWKAGETLLTGAYGIFEPRADSPTLEANDVDLILVPAVACDRRGYRLGYGGGYYDRLLSSPLWSSKPTIGIVFDFACLAEVPIDEWDKPLYGVCTENGLIMTR